MDLYFKQEVGVGFLVIVATLIFVGGLMWLSGIPFGQSGRIDVPVVFEDVGGLAEGDPVHVSGLNVGRIKSIELESIGRVRVVLEVPNSMPPHADAKATVGTLDFLGSMKVDYDPGSADAMLGEERSVVGSRAGGLAEGVPELADQATEVLIGAKQVLNENLALSINETMEALRAAMVAFEGTLNGPTVRQAQATLASLESVSGRLDSVLANPSIEESVNQLDEVMEGFREMSEGLAGATTALSNILEAVDKGEGTLGLAVNDSTLHHDLHGVLISMQALLDDMRARPGRYFRLKVF